MAATTASLLTTNKLNYQGRWIATSQNETPLISLITNSMMDREGSPFVNVGSSKFTMGQTYSHAAPSQGGRSENAMFNPPDSTIFLTTQEVGYTQAIQRAVKISPRKLKDYSISGNVIMDDIINLPEWDMQINANLESIRLELEYSALYGVEVDDSDPDVASQMKGLFTAITTNAIDAGGSAISKAIFEESLIVAMKGNGANLRNPVVIAPYKQMIRLQNLYTNTPMSANIGGANLVRLIVPTVGDVLLVPSVRVASTSIGLFDLSWLNIVSNTQPGQNQISIVDSQTVTRGVLKDILVDAGLDFGHESKHGAITNLAA